MELFFEILSQLVKDKKVEVNFPQIKDLQALVEGSCYKTLSMIREILQNEEYSDKDCFIRIEEIISILENSGIDFGFRHDFWF